MSVNKYKEHILVLPEDDANRQIANGFLLNPNLDERAIQILPPSGGWKKALDSFTNNHLSKMRQYTLRTFLLLIDFDLNEDRFGNVQNEIPDDLIDRVFVLGSQSEPEELKKGIANVNNFEAIGKALANDCVNKTYRIWGHKLLKHNQKELDRMIASVKPFLFH
ncbi:hypothetical protein QUF75_17095 [Desulfococcaceae bacterium HSG7]|nr:hypothetical protein [Desulfococcaceae bacterium HSG7]